tara:strand:+ start:347 stop:535 length:189 start_codon:yes stop_codon:yes gene_type:complete
MVEEEFPPIGAPTVNFVLKRFNPKLNTFIDGDSVSICVDKSVDEVYMHTLPLPLPLSLLPLA